MGNAEKLHRCFASPRMSNILRVASCLRNCSRPVQCGADCEIALDATVKSRLITTEKKKRAVWFTELNPSERSTFVSTFGGWALDGMDVMVYTFVIPSLVTAWHISK